MIFNILFLCYFISINFFIGSLITNNKIFPSQGISIDFLLNSVFGVIIVTYVIILLGILRLLYIPIIMSVINLLFIVALAAFFKKNRLFFMDHQNRQCLKQSIKGISKKALFLIAILIIILSAQFLLSSTPPYSKDALVYHLQAPKTYLSGHRLSYIPGNIFSNFPMNIEMLYLFGLSFKNDICPKIINLYFHLLLVFLIFLFIKRYANTEYAILGAILWSLIPSAFFIATIAYVDLEATFFVLLTTFFIILWSEKKDRSLLIVASVFTGFLIGIKYTSLLYYLLAICLIYICCKRDESSRIGLRHLVTFVLISSFIGCIWYLKNIIHTGNPIFPFCYRSFGGKGWDLLRADMYDIYLRNFGSRRPLGVRRSLIDYCLLPFHMSFQLNPVSSIYDGVIGPVFLLLLPMIVLTDKKWRASASTKILLYFTLFLYIGWMSTSMQIRFLLPCLCLLSIVILTALYHQRFNFLKYIFMTLAVLCLLINALVIFDNYKSIDPFLYLKGNNRSAFLEKNIPCYSTYREVNRVLSSKDYLYLVYMRNYGFLLDIPFYSDSIVEDYTIKKHLIVSPEMLYASLKKDNFSHLLIKKDLFLDINEDSSPEEIKNTLEMRRKFNVFTHRYLRLVFEDPCALLYKIL